MLVTFISQCEKKALKRTRRVLDSFAQRIGSHSWQTVITMDGLDAVRKLLRKSASKSTAVSCHLLRRNRTELLWVVGDRTQFNHQGFVPVHRSRIPHQLGLEWENNWHFLPLIKVIVALAALFHDWGKSSDCFQYKLTHDAPTDPLRHEWISCLLFNYFVNSETDEEWLTRLSHTEIDQQSLIVKLAALELDPKDRLSPFEGMPSLAQLVLWLILTHHRLPLPSDKKLIEKATFNDAITKEALLLQINQYWGYHNDVMRKQSCFKFKLGLPSQFVSWQKQAKKWAKKGLESLGLLASWEQSKLSSKQQRLCLHYARLALILGDHCFSSQKSSVPDKDKMINKVLIANTERLSDGSSKGKQTLEEHLLGVMKVALEITQLLPRFESQLPYASDIIALKKSSPPEYKWQNEAPRKIREWRSESQNYEQTQFGFFAINMASTGCGKTFANAKIMQSLSPSGDSLRYVLALGLRTLTLQTGDLYRKHLHLKNDELAVIIGSDAVTELHQLNQLNSKENPQNSSGSESEESLFDSEIDYDCHIPEDHFLTILKRKNSDSTHANKNQQLLYAPVLVCTIDHLMSASESIRGGDHILPSLRLLSSDLVIDEVDDFTGDDLIAVGRLIYLAGLSGRKVMLSSATIPPDLAEGYFTAYQQGWSIFAHLRDLSPQVGCAWVDEFKTQICTIEPLNYKESYVKAHDIFISKRIKQLLNSNPKRKAQIISLSDLKQQTKDVDLIKSIQKGYFEAILKTGLQLHQWHGVEESLSYKTISFGIVRMANVTPCIRLTHYLSQCHLPDDVTIKVMPYHSQQILLLRSEQERVLDHLFNRKNPDAIFQHPLIKEQIAECKTKHLIYFLVTTPIEEVGRDHDFDWAIIEPSSYRSMIQLAGRILRHRDEIPNHPNIALLQYNLKGMTQNDKSVLFWRPGYETELTTLEKSEGLVTLLTSDQVDIINAIPRIKRPNALNEHQRLVDLEHYSIAQILTASATATNLQGWIEQDWYLTGVVQQETKFRKSEPQITLYAIPSDDDPTQIYFHQKDPTSLIGITHAPVELEYRIKRDELTDLNSERRWLSRSYYQSLLEISIVQQCSLKEVAVRYGEISIRDPKQQENNRGYSYNDNYGLIKIDSES